MPLHPLTAALTLLPVVAGPPPAGPALGLNGTRFTLDGRPAFLLGMSYYAGCGAPAEFVRADFADLAAAGFNWVRVWATWGFFDHDVSAVGQHGLPREPYWSALRNLLAEAARHGLVVDLTLIHAPERQGQMTHLATFEDHQQAVRTLATELRPWRNWYLDLSNERSLQGKFVSYEDLGRLRDTAKAIDPERLVTASDVGEIDRDKLVGYLRTARLDFITPHRPRSAASARQNRQRTEQTLGLMRELGLVAPVHYQEPFRRGFTHNWEPTADDFLADLDGAIAGGAAGWCLHNGDERFADGARPRRSFDLRPAEGRLMDQLDPVEREVVRRIAARSGKEAAR